DDALAGMDALVVALEEADAQTWAGLGRPTSQLPRPEACRRPRTSQRVRTGEDGRRARRLLATGRASLNAGQHSAAAGAARLVAEIAAEHGEPELGARADWLLGSALADAGDYRGAVEHLGRAAWACSLLSCDGLSLTSMSDIVKILGSDLADVDEAVRWESRARQALAERGVGDPVVEASLYNAIGLLRLGRAEYEQAEASFRYAVSRVEGLADAELRLAGLYNNLANALEALGRSDDAIDIASQSLAMRERALGDQHPSLAAALSNLAISELAADRIDSARRHLRRAIAITQTAWGNSHPSLANYYNNLANVHYEQGELAEARQSYHRTLQVLRLHFGEEHPNVALTLGNLGLVTEEPAEALRLHRSALAMLEGGVPEGHPYLGMAHNNIGSALRLLGRYDEARSSYERALEIRDAALGPEHPLTATTIDNLGRTARLAGQPALAVTRHERSLAIWRASYGDGHRKVMIAQTGLADALLDAATDDATTRRARTLAEAALSIAAADDIDPVDRGAAQLALARALFRPPAPQQGRARRLATAAAESLRGPGLTTLEEAALAAVLGDAAARRTTTPPNGDPAPSGDTPPE
ncbi:MAG: tetratricopeptide repeat protein, partial [Myxococcota bacterium]